jgi:uncharacterized protein
VISNFIFLSKWLCLAFILESLMLTYIPAEKVANLIGEGNFAPIIISTFVGMPAYLNRFSALPLVSGFIEQGMNQGAGMSFLIAGDVTSLPATLAV